MVLCSCFFCFFFFFQAEDGIRDLTVTGVQTCALPISHGARSTSTKQHSLGPQPTKMCPVSAAWCWLSVPRADVRSGAWGSVRVERSEERRVGKECRSRWSPDEEKKKESAKQTDVLVSR